MLLTAWIQYQANVKINAARAGIDLQKLLDDVEASLEAVPNDEAPLTTDDTDLCDADDADEEDEDVGAQSGNWDDDEEEDASDDVESDDIATKVNDDALVIDAVRELSFRRYHDLLRQLESSQQTLNKIEEHLATANPDGLDVEAMNSMKFILSRNDKAMTVFLGQYASVVDLRPMGEISVRPFQKQAKNFGAPTISDNALGSLSLTGLYKKKSTRKSSRILCEPESFVDFSKPIIEAPDFNDRVRDAKLKASSENFCFLTLLA